MLTWTCVESRRSWSGADTWTGGCCCWCRCRYRCRWLCVRTSWSHADRRSLCLWRKGGSCSRECGTGWRGWCSWCGRGCLTCGTVSSLSEKCELAFELVNLLVLRLEHDPTAHLGHIMRVCLLLKLCNLGGGSCIRCSVDTLRLLREGLFQSSLLGSMLLLKFCFLGLDCGFNGLWIATTSGITRSKLGLCFFLKEASMKRRHRSRVRRALRMNFIT